MNYESVTFLSAELRDFDFYANADRTSELRNELLKKGYSIVGVKINGSQGFLVVGENYKKLIKLATKFNQSEIYVADKNRDILKINCLKPKSKVFLGKLLKRTKSVKIDSSNLTVTFIEDGTQHVFSTEQ